MRRPGKPIALLMLAVASLAFNESPAGASERPNVILCMADDMELH